MTNEEAIRKIKQTIIDDNPRDKLHPDEIILMPDHAIVIDRRKRTPWAVPFVIGEWS